ncbi:MAG: hypothetical protein ACYSSK_04955 [Planctomycetota bacterium]|jgi:hypothetical protein
MEISKKGRIITPGAYSWKHQLDGDPDGPLDGNAEDLEAALYMGCKCFSEKLDILEDKEIGKKKITRKDLDIQMLLGFGYLCRNYNLGNLDSDQIKQFESNMLELSQFIKRLQNNSVKIPMPVIEQLKIMGLFDET